MTTTDQTTPAVSSLLAVFTCWLRPATTAPRLAACKLRWAYLIHLLAGTAFFFVFIALVQIDVWFRGGGFNVLQEVAREWGADWRQIAVAVVSTALGIEAGFVGLALILLPWGAADERLRSSWAHALRFTWLHTTHALALLLVIGPAMLVLNNLPRSHYRAHPPPPYDVRYPPYPDLPRNAIPGSQAWKEHQLAVRQRQEAVKEGHNNWLVKYQQWRKTLPFLVRHSEALMAFLCTAGSAWFLWALFRATGARRMITTVQRPPTCDYCGYNLTATPLESRCPECGTPAMESLGPLVRPGTEWDRGAGLRILWRCAMEAVLRPRMLGRQIQVTTQPHRFRSFCWSLILSAAFVGAAAVPVGYVFAYNRNPLDYDIEVLTIGMPVTAACSGAGMLMIAMLVASIVGMILTWRYKRNLLPAAAQMASYSTLVFLAWGVFMAAWVVLFRASVESEWFQGWVVALGGAAVLPAFAGLLLPQLAWLVICFIFVWKGTTAARYASK